MSTRHTYRHRRVASGALQEIIDRAASADSHITPILAFAETCLQASVTRFRPRANRLVSSDTFTELSSLISEAQSGQANRKPDWVAKVTTVLHLTERMLGLLPSGEIWGSLAPNLVAHRKRSVACGTYSTPDLIAEQMCSDLLAALATVKRGATAKIVDLSVEAGHFPLSLLAKTPFSTTFYGIDRDPAALGVAERIFTHAQKVSGSRTCQLRLSRMDSIVDPLPTTWPQSFDAVVGNPPWKTRHPTDDQSMRERFHPRLIGHFDVYLAFILKAHEYLKPDGILSMVVPSSFLFNQNAEQVRNLLLREYRILRLNIFPRRSFIELPCVIPISFLARKCPSRTGNSCGTKVSYFHDQLGHFGRNARYTFRAASVWSKLPGRVLHPTARRQDLFLAKITGESQLAEWGKFSSGALLGKGKSASTTKQFLGFHARHLRPFHACPRDAVNYRRKLKVFDRCPPVQYLNDCKILFQDVRCMTLANRLVAAAMGPGSLSVNTASMFTPYAGSHVTFFEALFNSQLVNAWYKLRDVNRDLRLNILAQFPVICDDGHWKRIAAIGQRIGAIRRFHHRYLESCNFSNEHEILSDRFPRSWAKMSALKATLDGEIFDLYRLSSNERKAVKKLALTRVF